MEEKIEYVLLWEKKLKRIVVRGQAAKQSTEKTRIEVEIKWRKFYQ